ncbi:cutinase family protein [Corynebacterium sp. CCUG 65737]|uniref:cutinase family protein n=1 Tax=Corynebacterium sp. CCUG 65737 TaxID=2823889 RepID=UPI00210BE738|nr:cutinase family protein [Corynebacterium sp. CCUG 65737]MCQ4627873.1 cutinase family protein [Corynebacterium sp. CCUG 65737]
MKARNVLTVIAVIAVLAVIAVGAAQWFGPGEGPLEPGKDPAPPSAEEPGWCPAVEVISAPGTWESSKSDDPFNPTANPMSFMLSISQPLQEQYDINHVRVWTLPYTAQFKSIQSRKEMSYDDSRNEGTERLNAELKFVADTCPSTQFILAGFSQGAVIVGDIASDIGNHRGVIPPERLRGAVMIADGRRENAVGINPGVPLNGIGAEIALHPLNSVVQAVVPGATMRGVRDGGFGAVNDRAIEICAPDDSICDAPPNVGDALGRARELAEANGVHAMYASNPDVIPGTTTSQWTVEWIRESIDNM